MGAYIGRRLLQGALTVLAVSALVFAFMTMAGDPAILLLPPEAGTGELERFRRELGLDRPALRPLPHLHDRVLVTATRCAPSGTAIRSSR